MKKTAYNPYALGARREAYIKWSKLLTFGGTGLSVFLFFALFQLLVANGAPSWLSLAAYYLSEAVSTTVLFGIMALLVLSVSHEETDLGNRLVWQEIAALVSISLFLRMLLYYLTAVIDAKLDLGGFYFNDVTLTYLTEADGFQFFMATLSAFLGVVTMILVLLLSRYFVKRAYRQANCRGKTFDLMKKLPVLVYLAVSVASAVINTVISIVDHGIAFEFSVIFTLLLPYIEIALFTLVGHYVILAVVSHFEAA